MQGVFISYRREDSAGYTGRLFDILSAHFGRKNTYMDLDTIAGGDNFSAVIEDKISASDALLAVIGSRWLTVTEDNGKRRLDNPHDFVRLEIGKALQRGIRVIPVLVGGATLPHPEDLPEDLRPLCELQAVEIRDAHFHSDAQQLIEVLHKAVHGLDFRLETGRLRRFAPAFLSGVGVMMIVLGILLFQRTKPANHSAAEVARNPALATQRKLVAVEHELSTARRIQFSILPESAPYFEGIRIAMRYQPMTSVAGDFYDFLVSEHLLTILVADVSGHGVPAALLSCMLKVCFAAQTTNAPNPAAILFGLGLMLRGNLGGQYVTAACATIDKKSRTITYAGAGHPPSFLVRGEQGDAILLDQNGLFLGPFPNATYKNVSLPFRSGDRLFLYTDGITEAHGINGEEFGQERLRQFLIQSNGTDPSSTLDRLFRQIAMANPQDDLTAVLVHFD